MSDLRFTYTPAFALMRPLNQKGAAWVERNVAAAPVLGGTQYAIDHRYLADIVNAARESGLTCEG